jgi:hypothetical protein
MARSRHKDHLVIWLGLRPQRTARGWAAQSCNKVRGNSQADHRAISPRHEELHPSCNSQGTGNYILHAMCIKDPSP